MIDSLENELIKSDIKDSLEILNDLILNYKYIDIVKSIDYGEKGFEIAKRLNDSNSIAKLYHNLGGCYYQLDNIELAEELLNKAIKINKAKNNKEALLLNYIALSNFNFSKEKYNESEKILKEVYKDAESLGLEKVKVNVMSNLVSLYRASGDFENAIIHSEITIKLINSLKVKRFLLGQNYYALAYSKFFQNENPKSILPLLDSAQKYANLYEDKGLLTDIYISYSNVYQKLNDYKKSVEYLEKRIILKREISSITAQNQELLIKNINKNNEQKLEIEKQRQETKLNKMLAIITLIALLIILAVGILYYSKYRNTKVLYKKLENQNTIIEEETKTKEKLFSIIAHDLKNPLTAFTLTGDLLLKSFDKLTPNKIERNVKNLVTSGNNLKNMLNGLLDWSQSKMGFEYNSSDIVIVKEVIEEVISNHKLIASEKNIVITNSCNSETVLNTNENMFKTVIRNLLSNALKFSGINSEIQIQCINHKEYISIVIQDNGIGMSKRALKDFENNLINQSSAGTQGEIGTGLGLIIVRDFINKMNAKVEIDSELQIGTTVKLQFPKN
jgi:signal transduction histidine kinase